MQLEAYLMVGHHTLITIETYEDSALYHIKVRIAANDYQSPQKVMACRWCEVKTQRIARNYETAIKIFSKLVSEELTEEMAL